jgi:hypothetical protein
MSSLQKTTATSSVHSEWLALYLLACNLVHLREHCREMRIDTTSPTPCYEDNAPAINWSETTAVRRAQRHIRTKYFFTQSLCTGPRPEMKVLKIASASNPADILTKATSSVLLRHHLPVFGMYNRSS